MLRDNPEGSSSRWLSNAGGPSPALHVDGRKSSDDRPSCLENPRPAGAESTLTENASPPFDAEPRQVSIAVSSTTVFKTLPRIRYSPKLGHSGERGAGAAGVLWLLSTSMSKLPTPPPCRYREVCDCYHQLPDIAPVASSSYSDCLLTLNNKCRQVFRHPGSK